MSLWPPRVALSGRSILCWMGVMLLAAGLRLWSLDFGLDVERVRPDEEFVSGVAQRMLETGDLNPRFFHYPSLLMYVDAALLRLAGPSLEARLVGRLVSVACAIGTVLLLAVLGTRLFSPGVGLAAALLLAVAYGHVRESHFGTTDVPFSFLVAASLAAATEGKLRSQVSWFRASALLAGLAASTKYPGLLSAAPALLLGAGLSGLSLREKAREALVGLAIFAAAFAATSPFVLLDSEGARQSLSELFQETWGEGRLSGSSPLFPLTFSLRYGAGLPFLAVAAMGLASTVRSWQGQFLIAWFLTFYAAAALTPTHFARYALPTLLPLCLAAAAFIVRLPWASAWKAALLIVVMARPFRDSVAFDLVLGREDTRSSCAAWIAENLPRGTGILVSEGYGAPTIPKGYTVREVTFRAGAVRDGERRGFRYLVTHEHPALARFSRVDASLQKRLESALLLKRFDPFRPGEAPGRFDELDAFYVPYETPGSVERPGPIVSIWRLDPEGNVLTKSR